ncbi:hypothetical protein FRX31_029270 [Thalictrum thalictroides]|uniref:Uncharacterized protein n=1 Tax=Thalictrum thalictroides TaxID=46969 RepID=A0A7J6V7Z1_THATH|nr:hypothetical protein FRX31_029270 [Thalictrum thalictroides]
MEEETTKQRELPSFTHNKHNAERTTILYPQHKAERTTILYPQLNRTRNNHDFCTLFPLSDTKTSLEAESMDWWKHTLQFV